VFCIARKSAVETETYLYSLRVTIGIASTQGDILLADVDADGQVPDGVTRLIYSV
jgi:hypothetical protein